MTENLTWMPISRAAGRFRTSTNKINELVKAEKVRSKKSPMNKRMILICVEDLRDIIGSIPQPLPSEQ